MTSLVERIEPKSAENVSCVLAGPITVAKPVIYDSLGFRFVPEAERRPGIVFSKVDLIRSQHLGLRTQASGKQSYVVVRRPSNSTKLVVVRLCDVSTADRTVLKLAAATNAQMDAGTNPNLTKKTQRTAERAAKASKVKHTFFASLRALCRNGMSSSRERYDVGYGCG